VLVTKKRASHTGLCPSGPRAFWGFCVPSCISLYHTLYRFLLDRARLNSVNLSDIYDPVGATRGLSTQDTIGDTSI
jgi:hypothetical protein